MKWLLLAFGFVFVGFAFPHSPIGYALRGVLFVVVLAFALRLIWDGARWLTRGLGPRGR